MRDRVVQFPHRYRDKITGQVLDLEPLPGEISDEGTPLNKANLLSDRTAILYGTDTVDEALYMLLPINRKGLKAKYTLGTAIDGIKGTHFMSFTSMQFDQMNLWALNNPSKFIVHSDFAFEYAFKFTIQASLSLICYSDQRCGLNIVKNGVVAETLLSGYNAGFTQYTLSSGTTLIGGAGDVFQIQLFGNTSLSGGGISVQSGATLEIESV